MHLWRVFFVCYSCVELFMEAKNPSYLQASAIVRSYRNTSTHGGSRGECQMTEEKMKDQVKWCKPQSGWFKLNCDAAGRTRGLMFSCCASSLGGKNG